jgi:hypothetical protein
MRGNRVGPEEDALAVSQYQTPAGAIVTAIFEPVALL